MSEQKKRYRKPLTKEQKEANKKALLESYNLSKRQRKQTRMKKKGDNPIIKKVIRVDW